MILTSGYCREMVERLIFLDNVMMGSKFFLACSFCESKVFDEMSKRIGVFGILLDVSFR